MSRTILGMFTCLAIHLFATLAQAQSASNSGNIFFLSRPTSRISLDDLRNTPGVLVAERAYRNGSKIFTIAIPQGSGEGLIRGYTIIRTVPLPGPGPVGWVSGNVTPLSGAIGWPWDQGFVRVWGNVPASSVTGGQEPNYFDNVFPERWTGRLNSFETSPSGNVGALIKPALPTVGANMDTGALGIVLSWLQSPLRAQPEYSQQILVSPELFSFASQRVVPIPNVASGAVTAVVIYRYGVRPGTNGLAEDFPSDYVHLPPAFDGAIEKLQDFLPKGKGNKGEPVSVDRLTGSGPFSVAGYDGNGALAFSQDVSFGTTYSFIPGVDLSRLEISSFGTNQTFTFPDFDARLNPGSLFGVDFRSMDVRGVCFDSALSTVRLITRATPDGTSSIPDANAEQRRLERVFMQALATPNDRQYVSLDTNPAPHARADASFKQTDLARYFFQGDVQMKKDLAQSLGRDLFQPLFNDLQQSPYFGELREIGISASARALIKPLIASSGSQAESARGCAVVDDARFHLERALEAYQVNLVGPQGDALNDLTARANNFQPVLLQRFNSAADAVEPLINAGGGEYQPLRSSLSAIVAAHWYKANAQPGWPYYELINSTNYGDFATTIPFDQGYWDAQASQVLSANPFDGMTGTITGGVELTGNVVGQIGAGLQGSQAQYAAASFDDLTYQRTDGGYVIGGGALPQSVAQLAVVGNTIKTPPANGTYYGVGENVDFEVTVVNGGNADICNVVLSLYNVVTAVPQGEVETHFMGSYTLQGCVPPNNRFTIPLSFSASAPVLNEIGLFFNVSTVSDPIAETRELRKDDNVAAVTINARPPG